MKFTKTLLGVLCSIATAWAGDVTPASIHEAATKAVAALQNSQKAWYTKETCASCHQQVFPAMAFRAAREHGIPIDEPAALADAQAAFRFYSNLDRAVEYTYVIDPALGDVYLLLGAEAAGVRPSIVTAVYARLLAARQEADGHWETFDERPPQSYSAFTATAISVRALQLYSHASQRADIVARTARAKHWLLSQQPRATEERAYQLMGAKWAGADDDALERIAAELKATQQEDGGWNSVEGRASDAYSTGRALLALHDAGGVRTADPGWRRGIEYLIRTQAADGTWRVESRLHPPAPVSPPYIETGHPYGHDQFISSMGESLAVMALAAALGDGKASPRLLRAAEPVGIEPWAETLLFGSAADLQKLLDSGFDPNSATKSGNVTALMLATPDTEKMKILLDHGANADARAKNRYSALLVAAQYTGSTSAMNLLLDHGAKVRLPKGEGAPFFNAFPVMLAAMAGNSEVIGRLVKEGDRVDDKINLIGMFPVTPMLALATTHRTNCASALLDAGAKVDQVDGDGLTSLSWAAISNRLDMARLLISRGADVNHLDKKGMTPLLYAASIDFSNSEMIDLLLRSGARADARNGDGLTALDLARKYKHTHLLASLQGLRASR
ncbi:MAG: ankyrin repeat domain-containing protein [Acidobacteriaceae bacterium]|nr:ankyrin repeat domain-containing protein [Acidobacteriaceae bacterium]